jgi:serine/threonine protein kinase
MPVFATSVFLKYAITVGFMLSLSERFLQPSGHSDSTDNDEKGSLPYMAPEIFEKRCKHKHAVNTPMASTPVAGTPLCATPTRMSASASQPAATPGAQLLMEQEAQKNKHRDIWAFGCVLYELATHRRPWYHKMPSASATLKSSGAESLCGDSKLPQTQPDLHLFFLRTFWKKLGKFHGGWPCPVLFVLAT